MQSLPIDALIPSIIESLRTCPRLVLEAEAGAGKTTRVPPSLLDSGLFSGQIWVAEPRRIAARLVAHRVAGERRETIGGTVGYTVRFEDKTTRATRLRYVTSGILLRRLESDPRLEGVDCVILDEFHERHLDTDLALALLLRLVEDRPELRLVVMSATLDGAKVAAHLGDCPRLHCHGRTFPLTESFESNQDDRPLEKRVTSAVRSQIREDPKGSILVFLPGAAEIRRCTNSLLGVCESEGYDLLALHGELPIAEQARAIEPGPRPRVVLSTNVAESSVTVDGITSVVDSGLVRSLQTPTSSGISTLRLTKISRASAKQRGGRAGRIAPGRVLRLYSKGDFESRPEFDTPEILRLDFSEALLLLHGCGIDDVARVKLLDRPDQAKIAAAHQLLVLLGAVDERHRLTTLGERMLPLGIHPRLARLALACLERDQGTLGAIAAALLAERDIRVDRGNALQGRGGKKKDVVAGSSDLLELVELFEWARELEFEHRSLLDLGLDVRATRSVSQAASRLERSLEQLSTRSRARVGQRQTPSSREETLSVAALLAYPDRVAKRRVPRDSGFVLRGGQSARLSEQSVVVDANLIVAIDVEERQNPGRPPETLIRMASELDPDLLLDVVAEQLESEEELLWTDPPGRVEERSRIKLGSLTIDESRRPARPGPDTARVLLAKARERGLFRAPELVSLGCRLRLLKDAQLVPELVDDFEAVLETAAAALLAYDNSLTALDPKNLANGVEQSLPAPLPECLRRDVPEHVNLPGGRKCSVHYEPGQNPWIESRLQDFFGMGETPKIARGRIELTVHLLAPNQRAVQITNDLRGFWSTHYPTLRRQLMRRYPKHAWPEDGATAQPPEPRGPRPRT
jgi:ATP-dependent helicase HrpB